MIIGKIFFISGIDTQASLLVIINTMLGDLSFLSGTVYPNSTSETKFAMLF